MGFFPFVGLVCLVGWFFVGVGFFLWLFVCFPFYLFYTFDLAEKALLSVSSQTHGTGLAPAPTAVHFPCDLILRRGSQIRFHI